jgi:NhaP-type Na+/H+ and K+/H+ antiporter
VIEPEGNGLIAVFICAIVLGIRRSDLRHAFASRAEDLVEICKLGIFVVFGSLLTIDGLFDDGLATVAIAVVALFVARPVAVWIALAGTGRSTAETAFMAWFGPRGVATMAFSLLVLSAAIPNGERIFNIAAFCVLCSIVAHGLSDTPGVRWIAARSGDQA